MVLTRNSTKKAFLIENYLKLTRLIDELHELNEKFDSLSRNHLFVVVKTKILIVENRIWEKVKNDPSFNCTLLHDLVTKLVAFAQHTSRIDGLQNRLFDGYYDMIVDCCEAELEFLNPKPQPEQLPLQ